MYGGRGAESAGRCGVLGKGLGAVGIAPRLSCRQIAYMLYIKCSAPILQGGQQTCVVDAVGEKNRQSFPVKQGFCTDSSGCLRGFQSPASLRDDQSLSERLPEQHLIAAGMNVDTIRVGSILAAVFGPQRKLEIALQQGSGRSGGRATNCEEKWHLQAMM